MRNSTTRLLTLLTLLNLFAAPLFAGATPSLLNYQGLLADASGAPLTASGVSITFRIWGVPTGNDPVFLKWEETLTVDVENGLFNVILGEVVPIDEEVFSSSESYLGIAVGADAEGVPRTRLVSVGYSTKVETLDGARGGVISGSIDVEPLASTKNGQAVAPAYTLLNAQRDTLYYADANEVYTPCVLFKDDLSRQCTAAVNSGASQAEVSGQITTVGSNLTLLASQSITCPVDGYVLALGSCEASITPNGGSCAAAEFGVSLRSDSLENDQRKVWSMSGINSACTFRNVIAVQKIFSVSAGEATFYLLGKRTLGSQAFQVDEKTLSLLFVPKAYGVVGTPSVMAASPAGDLVHNLSSVSRMNAPQADEIATLKAELDALRQKLDRVTGDSR